MLAKHADARGNGLSFELKIAFCKKFQTNRLLNTPGLSFLAKRILNISRSLIRRYFLKEINLSPEIIHKTSEQGDDKCCVSVDFRRL